MLQEGSWMRRSGIKLHIHGKQSAQRGQSQKKQTDYEKGLVNLEKVDTFCV